MATLFDDVADFHKRFGHPAPTELQPLRGRTPDQMNFRLKLLKEEYEELTKALKENASATKISRELVDLVYVTIGTAVAYGIPFDDIWQIVHKANMEKTPSGSPTEKPTKPPGWVDPDKQIEDYLMWYILRTDPQ